MKKIIIYIGILSVLILTFGAEPLLLALGLGDTLEITGNRLLPDLFYEHNLYDHRTEFGDIIYCVDPDKVGTEHSNYAGRVVEDLDFYSDQQIAILTSLIFNGYPNQEPSTANRNFSGSEYHCITAMAMRALCMEFKGMTRGKTAEDYISVQYGDAGAKSECRRLILQAKKNPFIKKYNDISIKCLSKNNIEILDDSTRVGKEYVIEGSNISGAVSIKLKGINDKDIIMPKTVAIGQKFFISVPKSKTYTAINETFEVKAKTNESLVFIKANGSDRQSYIGLIKVNQELKLNYDFNMEPNIAKIKLIKKDTDTKENLPGATFRFWSKKPASLIDKNNLCGEFTTNEVGVLVVDNLSKLGACYFSEIKSPIGYPAKAPFETGEIVVDKFGITYEKIVYNKQKPLLETFIQLDGYRQVASFQPLEYKVFGAINASNVSLKDFSINIPLPHEYYSLNNRIEIGSFIENEAYLMYFKDINDNVHEIKKSYIDSKDNQVSVSEQQTTRNIKGIFTNTDEDAVEVPNLGMKEMTIKLVPESKGSEFKTPIFGKGTYSIFIKNQEREYLLGSNYDGMKVNYFKCNDLRSYRIVFDKPVFISNFKNGTFKALEQGYRNYSVILNTDKRKGIEIGSDFVSNKKNVINIADIIKQNKLMKNETITNVNIRFNEAVKPGFRQKEPIILSGQSKDLNLLTDKYFNGDRNILFYENRVEIEGFYGEEKAANSDEWETNSYSRDVLLKKGAIPKTGAYSIAIVGFTIIAAGIYCIFIWRHNVEK